MYRPLVLLSRIRHFRGCGVQSPYAFHLIRDVLKESHPYYAYAEMKQKLSRQCRRSGMRYLKMVFRLVNFVQPGCFLVPRDPWASPLEFVCAKACRSTRVMEYEASGYVRLLDGVFSEGSPVVVRVDAASPDAAAVYERVAAKAHAQTWILLDGIYTKSSARALWRQVKADARARLSFDMYVTGLVSFDSIRHKETHKVLF